MYAQKKKNDPGVFLAGFTAMLLLCGCDPKPASSDAEALVSQGTRPASSDATAIGLAPPPHERPLRAVAGEYLVKFKAGTSRSSVARTLGKASLKSVREFQSVPGLHLVRAADGATSAGISKAQFDADPQVEYIEPNFIYHESSVPNDPDYPRLWAMHNTGQTGGGSSPYFPDISAEPAWDITTGSDEVVVAVIDSGVDYLHEDLAANIWSNATDCDADGVDDDGNGYVDDCHGIDVVDNDSDPMDGESHGTHVAGIIGAVGNNGVGIAGVAWHVKILPCRFIDSTGSGDTANAIRCLDYIALMKQRGVNIIASNNSWGSTENSRALADAVRAQRDLNILFVAAAGNDILQDDDIIPEYPCAHDVENVICVASAYESIDLFSNFGRGTVLLGAPGFGIYSTVPGNKYDWKDGTSMATPHVTGALVLLKAQDPSRDAWALRNLLVAGAVAPREYSIPTVAEGRLDLLNSLTCTDRTVLARLRPMTFEPLSRAPGDRVNIRALHVRCAAPAGDVVVSVTPGGETITLHDDGVGGDAIAGDGVYSTDWIAHGGGEYTFSFPAPETETFAVDVDPFIKSGFPLMTATQNIDNVPGMGGGEPLVVGNITGDARLEIVSLSGNYGPLNAWSSSGQILPGFPNYLFQDTVGLTLGNFDDNPADLELNAQYLFGMHEYQGDGSAISGWPQGGGTALSNFAAADIDGDGVDEILSYPARRADGSAFRSDVAVPARPDDAGGAPYGVKVGDLDADGHPDFVGIVQNGVPYLWVSDADGLRPGFPVPLPGGTNNVAAIRPLIGDVDGDGSPNIIIGSVDYANSRGQVQVFDNRGRLLRTLYSPQPSNENLALADIDGDGIPEIVKVGGTQIDVWHGDGTSLPGWPRRVSDVYLGGEPAIGDVDGDGSVDIVATGLQAQQSAQSRESLHIFRADGTYLPGFPRSIATDGGGASTPVIADIDLDGRNEIVVAYGRGLGLRETIFAYDLHGTGPYGPVEWSQDSGNARHTGYYETGRNLENGAYLATQVYGAGRISSNGGGINCGIDCIERYAKGTQVVLTATAGSGGTFRRWRGACAAQGNPCTLPIQRFTEASADFDSRLTVTIAGDGAVTSDINGIRCPGDCDESFPGRSMVTLTAAQTSASAFTGWSGACSGSATTCQVFIDDAKNVTANFASEFPLTVAKSGAGTAVVTSSGTGINCGAVCRANFAVRSHAILTIVPSADTRLVSWHRLGCLDYQLTCDVLVDGDLTLNIELALKPVLSVTVSGRGRLTSQPTGVDCASSCQVPVDIGLITLNAVPEPGVHFERFEGLCAGGGNIPSCNHYMDADAAVTVIFSPDPVLTYTRTGNGSGTVAPTTGEFSCTTDCAQAVPTGRILTLVATANEGSTFAGWTGACSGTSYCTITMISDLAVSATFNRTSSGGGSGGGGTSGGGGKGGGGIDVLDLCVLAALVLALKRRRSTQGFVYRIRRLREPDRLLLSHVEAVLESDAELPR